MTQQISAEQNFLMAVQAKIRCASCGSEINKFVERGQGQEKNTCNRDCGQTHYVVMRMLRDLLEEFELRTDYEKKGKYTKEIHNYVVFALKGIDAGVPSYWFNEGMKQIRKAKACSIDSKSKLYQHYLQLWSIRV